MVFGLDESFVSEVKENQKLKINHINDLYNIRSIGPEFNVVTSIFSNSERTQKCQILKSNFFIIFVVSEEEILLFFLN